MIETLKRRYTLPTTPDPPERKAFYVVPAPAACMILILLSNTPSQCVVYFAKVVSKNLIAQTKQCIHNQHKQWQKSPKSDGETYGKNDLHELQCFQRIWPWSWFSVSRRHIIQIIVRTRSGQRFKHQRKMTMRIIKRRIVLSIWNICDGHSKNWSNQNVCKIHIRRG